MLADALRLLVTWAAYAVVLAAALWIVTWPALWTRGKRRGWQPWALWILALVAVAAAYAPLAADLERRMRVAKGRGNALLLGKAVEAYAAHCGGPPATDATGGDCRVAGGAGRGPLPRALLERQRNARGVEAGPFLEFIPRLPRGWSGLGGTYAYVVDAAGRTRVCGAGDGVVADSRGSRACP
ncbi:MAG TPA: hypothetical protein VFW70_06190 [Methylomirabilota bacterium]|nr:hypothetical protein [Methylomirabilota bacterium]